MLTRERIVEITKNMVGMYADPEDEQYFNAADAILAEMDEPLALEPKMGGLVCPHCERVVCPPNKAASYLPEPLAVVADRHDLDVIIAVPEAKNEGLWVIWLEAIEENERFEGKTYAEAEAKARAFLNGLEDKK